MNVGWEGSPPYFIYTHHTPISRHRSFFFLSFGHFVFSLHVSPCRFSASFVVVNKTATYPELYRLPRRCCNNLCYRRRGTASIKLHRCSWIPSRNQTNNPDFSMKLVWVLVHVTQFQHQQKLVEHSCLVSSADPVQQNPCVSPVQVGQILDRSTLSETICSGYLSSHSLQTVLLHSLPAHLLLLPGDRAVFSGDYADHYFSSPQIVDRRTRLLTT